MVPLCIRRTERLRTIHLEGLYPIDHILDLGDHHEEARGVPKLLLYQTIARSQCCIAASEVGLEPRCLQVAIDRRYKQRELPE